MLNGGLAALDAPSATAASTGGSGSLAAAPPSTGMNGYMVPTAAIQLGGGSTVVAPLANWSQSWQEFGGGYCSFAAPGTQPTSTSPAAGGLDTGTATAAGMGSGPATVAAAGARSPVPELPSGPAAKRKGRKPADPSTLTEKQLRAREAQKRFREKQKRVMLETEEALRSMSAEMQMLRWVLAGLCGVAPQVVLFDDPSRCVTAIRRALTSPVTHQPMQHGQ